jgi:hypothetical protein
LRSEGVQTLSLVRHKVSSIVDDAELGFVGTCLELLVCLQLLDIGRGFESVWYDRGVGGVGGEEHRDVYVVAGWCW